MRSFASLFQGRDDVYGWYGDVSKAKPSTRGKRVARASTRQERVTQALFDAHNKGEQRLGIVPIRKDGTVMWFVIDVDFYQDKGLHEEIAKSIEEAGLPLVQTRSKSGGAHLWCFLSDPMSAIEARQIAESFQAKLALPKEHVEIFPKQAAISSGDTGSWVNLPYFGKQCHCVPDGVHELDMKEFLKYANDHIVHPSDLRLKKKERVKASKSSIPPCIERMQADGVEEGGRNDAVMHFCVYAKRAFPDDWQEKVEEFNEEHVFPHLNRDEMKDILRSAARKDYQYLCTRFPAICDKAACMKREFGIGRSDDVLIDFIEKIDGEEPIYLVTIDGKRFQCNGDQLFQYTAFRKVAMKAINRLLPAMKQFAWEEILEERLQTMDISDPPDTQMRDRVLYHFQKWCDMGCVSDNIEDAIASGAPFYDGHDIVFRGEDFMALIDRQLRIPRNDTWIYMRDAGAVEDKVTIDNKPIKTWRYVVRGDLWFDPDRGKRK